MRDMNSIRFPWASLLGIAVLAFSVCACGDGPAKRTAMIRKTPPQAQVKKSNSSSLVTDLSVRDRGKRPMTARWKRSSLGSER